MAVPKHRTSSSKRDMRRSHHAVRAPGASSCPNCGEIRYPHRVCESCGHYRGKQVVAPRSKGAEQTFDTEA